MQNMIDAFKDNLFKPTTGVDLPYRLYAPTVSRSLPLVLFLHGSG